MSAGQIFANKVSIERCPIGVVQSETVLDMSPLTLTLTLQKLIAGNLGVLQAVILSCCAETNS